MVGVIPFTQVIRSNTEWIGVIWIPLTDRGFGVRCMNQDKEGTSIDRISLQIYKLCRIIIICFEINIFMANQMGVLRFTFSNKKEK